MQLKFINNLTFAGGVFLANDGVEMLWSSVLGASLTKWFNSRPPLTVVRLVIEASVVPLGIAVHPRKSVVSTRLRKHDVALLQNTFIPQVL